MHDLVPPFEPPRRFDDLPAAGGELGKTPEDFQVDEVPLYPCAGTGDHRYLLVWKRNQTTAQAMRILARAAGVDERDLGRAGLKDRFAVTTQWISVPKAASDPSTWDLPDDIRILESTWHTNKLRPGHLLANAFTLRFSGMNPERCLHILERIRHDGIANWYGYQRFGREGRNLTEALRWLREGGRGRGRQAHFQQSLYPSVIQSEFFNRYAFARLQAPRQPLAGEYVRLQGTGSYRHMTDVDDLKDRLQRDDAVLTGPLPGGRLRAATEDALRLEQRVAADMALSESDLQALGGWVDGTRRDLIVRPEEVSAEFDAAKDVMTVRFQLPAGSYATVLARELTGLSWQNPLRADAPLEDDHA